jgi:hypothetical protein
MDLLYLGGLEDSENIDVSGLKFFFYSYLTDSQGYFQYRRRLPVSSYHPGSNLPLNRLPTPPPPPPRPPRPPTAAAIPSYLVTGKTNRQRSSCPRRRRGPRCYTPLSHRYPPPPRACILLLYRYHLIPAESSGERTGVGSGWDRGRDRLGEDK